MNAPRWKPLRWVASSRRDMQSLPIPAQKEFGHQLRDAQAGQKPADAKPLRGFRGAGVLELIEDFQTDTYRAVYTVNFPGCLYVLHVFQKKSKRGIETPKPDMDLIHERYKQAERHYQSLRAEDRRD